MKKDKGIFITFEGCEGVGKSTQVRLLREYMEKSGQDALFLREPGDTEVGEKIRDIVLHAESVNIAPETESLLFAAARAQIVNEKILPALNDCKLVVCDRYYDSSIAYQGYARGLGEDFVRRINSYAIDLATPNYTVFLDLDPSYAFKRKGGVDIGDRMESEGIVFHRRVYEGFKSIVQREPDRFICVKPLGTKYETHETILSELKKRGIIK